MVYGHRFSQRIKTLKERTSSKHIALNQTGQFDVSVGA